MSDNAHLRDRDADRGLQARGGPPSARDPMLDRLALEDLVARQSMGESRLSMLVQVAVVVALLGVFVLMLMKA